MVYAHAPYYENGTFVGEIYIIRAVRYLFSIVLTFVIVLTILYAALAMVLLINNRSNRRVAEIYSRYIANVSHELKTPIASIQATVEMLSDGLVSDEAEISRCYGSIYRESRQLERTVLNIIKLSKIQDHQIDFAKSRLDPAWIFAPLCQKYEERCADLDIDFICEIKEGEFAPVYTNADRIRELTEILLDNAIKFTDFGGQIRISACKSRSKSHLIFVIEDNGCGISKEDMPHIFERFYHTQEGNPGGTGLGLSIAKEICDGLNEQLWCESKQVKDPNDENHGSRFCFTLKIA